MTSLPFVLYCLSVSELNGEPVLLMHVHLQVSSSLLRSAWCVIVSKFLKPGTTSLKQHTTFHKTRSTFLKPVSTCYARYTYFLPSFFWTIYERLLLICLFYIVRRLICSASVNMTYPFATWLWFYVGFSFKALPPVTALYRGTLLPGEFFLYLIRPWRIRCRLCWL